MALVLTTVLLGAHPSPQDPKDLDFQFGTSELRAGANPTAQNSPSLVDAHTWRVQRYNDCVGETVVQPIQDMATVLGIDMPDLSPLYPYGGARFLQFPPKPGELLPDTGTNMRLALSWAMHKGVVAETVWPETDENVGLVPPLDAQEEGALARVKSYHRIVAANATDLKTQLIEALKLAVVGQCGVPGFCMPVYENYVTIGAAVYTSTAGKLLGGHAQEILGYDAMTDSFLIAGTWGTGVGDRGLFRISSEMMFRIGSEFWVCVPEIATMKVAA